MKRIDIKVGFQCCNRCRFCVQGDKRYEFPDKNTNEIKKILKNSRKEAEGVVFTGGEPTMRPKELLKWVAYAKELGYSVIQIQSNGRSFSYLSYCKDVVKAGANQFALALHGSNAKIHDYLTRAPGSFEQTVQGIKNLKSLNQCVLMNTVITKPNYKDLPKIAKLLVNLRVNQFQFAFIHINKIIASDLKLMNEIVPKKSEVMPYVKKGLQIGIDAGIKVMTEAIPYCFMAGYEEYIAERIIPKTSVFDANLVLKDYSQYRKNQGKLKGPECKKCKYYQCCEGPWREYPEIFGWSEFKPVLK